MTEEPLDETTSIDALRLAYREAGQRAEHEAFARKWPDGDNRQDDQLRWREGWRAGWRAAFQPTVDAVLEGLILVNQQLARRGADSRDLAAVTQFLRGRLQERADARFG